MSTAEEIEKCVFFVTRIGKDDSLERTRSDDLMELVLEPAVREFNPDLRVVRADKLAAHGRITDNIIHHLLLAPYIIVDATGQNPNVYYELGVAHTFHKKIVLMIDDPGGLPFDTQGEAHIIIPGAGELSGRVIHGSIPQLVAALKASDAAVAPPGPVASAQGQLTAPDISGAEATELLRNTVRELSDRLESLERWAVELRAAAVPPPPPPPPSRRAQDRLRTARRGSRPIERFVREVMELVSTGEPMSFEILSPMTATIESEGPDKRQVMFSLDMPPPSIAQMISETFEVNEASIRDRIYEAARAAADELRII